MPNFEKNAEFCKSDRILNFEFQHILERVRILDFLMWIDTCANFDFIFSCLIKMVNFGFSSVFDAFECEWFECLNG